MLWTFIFFYLTFGLDRYQNHQENNTQTTEIVAKIKTTVTRTAFPLSCNHVVLLYCSRCIKFCHIASFRLSFLYTILFSCISSHFTLIVIIIRSTNAFFFHFLLVSENKAEFHTDTNIRTCGNMAAAVGESHLFHVGVWDRGDHSRFSAATEDDKQFEPVNPLSSSVSAQSKHHWLTLSHTF